MNSLRPTFVARGVEALTPISVVECDIRSIALDVDGTLSDYHSAEVEPSVSDTLSELGHAGLTLFIISNAYGHRVEQLAEIYGEVVPEANIITPELVAPEGENLSSYRKPNPAMLLYASKMSGINPEQTLMVGDQLFKDVLSANRAGAKSLLVPRRGTNDHPGVRLQRAPEMLARATLGLPAYGNRLINTFPEEITRTSR